jgi:predicted ATP-dependent endonuclease of OLD family
MRIDKIHIQNFKGFEDQIFEFKEQVTVFIGDNAKGKTSVLDALAIAAGSFFLGIEDIAEAEMGIKDVKRL